VCEAVALAFLIPGASDGHGLPIRGYGLMMMLGIVCGVSLSNWICRRMGVDPDVLMTLAMWLVISGLLGARVFFVAQYHETFLQGNAWENLVKVADITKGGLVFYGSMVGGIVGLIAFAMIYKLPTAPLMDLAAPSFMLGLCLGRVGCFLNGCCFGGVCDLPWAVTFPHGSPPYQRQLEKGEIDRQSALAGLKFAEQEGAPAAIVDVEPGSYAWDLGLKKWQVVKRVGNLDVERAAQVEALLSGLLPGEQTVLELADSEGPAKLTWVSPLEGPRSQPVHPVQLYAAINAGLLALLLVAYYPYRSRDGEVTLLMLTLYPIARFLEEAIRTDEGGQFGTSFSIAQLVSLCILAVALCGWAWLLSRPRGSILPPKDRPLAFAAEG
jgi:phosphatidylglycerol:prolipoprotein diacylglycerol transferase